MSKSGIQKLVAGQPAQRKKTDSQWTTRALQSGFYNDRQKNHTPKSDTFFKNLCYPFKYDLCCTLFSLHSPLKTKSTPQREAQWRSYLNELHRLYSIFYIQNILYSNFIQ